MYTRQCILTILARVLIISLFLGSINVMKSQPCNDSRCRTGSCNITTGACICNLPNPSTILDGNRPFLGGKFCDEGMSMCDGTNSFWCEHGGECEEIVQGEIYKCNCSLGFSGDHCEHSGSACGRSFCYNGGHCLVEGDDGICQCSPGWKGNADCSLPTESQPADSSTNATVTKLTQKEISNHASWMVVVFAISCSAIAAAAAAIYIKKLFCKKRDAATNFQRSSRMQTHDLLDEDGSDDEESSMVTKTTFAV